MNKVKETDQFSETIQLTFDGGKSNHKTYLGAFLTLTMLITVLAWSLEKFYEMIQR